MCASKQLATSVQTSSVHLSAVLWAQTPVKATHAVKISAAAILQIECIAIVAIKLAECVPQSDRCISGSAIAGDTYACRFVPFDQKSSNLEHLFLTNLLRVLRSDYGLPSTWFHMSAGGHLFLSAEKLCKAFHRNTYC